MSAQNVSFLACAQVKPLLLRGVSGGVWRLLEPGTEGGQGGPGRGGGGSSGPGFNPLGVLQLQAGPDRMWEARWGLQVRRSGGDRIWLLVGRRRPMAGAAVGG